MRAFDEICDSFLSNHPEDAARVMESLPNESLGLLFLRSRPTVLANPIGRMVPNSVANLMRLQSPERAAALLGALDIEVAVGVLRRIPESERLLMLRGLPKEKIRTLRNLIHYSESSAAAFMDPNVVALAGDHSVGEARKSLKEKSLHALFYLYVIDRSQKLIGVVNMRDLFHADSGELLSHLMKKGVTSIEAEAPSSSVLQHPGWKEFHALPVIDAKNRFLGAIKYETLRLLQQKSSPSRSHSAISAGLALGELFLLGLRGVGEGIASGFGAPGDSN